MFAAWLSQQLAHLANRSFQDSVEKVTIEYESREVGPVRRSEALSM